jgi:hypothetical protein
MSVSREMSGPPLQSEFLRHVGQRGTGISEEVWISIPFRMCAIGWHTSRQTYRFMAGRDRGSHEGATGTDAACLDPNDDECLGKLT